MIDIYSKNDVVFGTCWYHIIYFQAPSLPSSPNGLASHESLRCLGGAFAAQLLAVQGEGQAHPQEDAVVDGDVALQEGGPRCGHLYSLFGGYF